MKQNTKKCLFVGPPGNHELTPKTVVELLRRKGFHFDLTLIESLLEGHSFTNKPTLQSSEIFNRKTEEESFDLVLILDRGEDLSTWAGLIHENSRSCILVYWTDNPDDNSVDPKSYPDHVKFFVENMQIMRTLITYFSKQ